MATLRQKRLAENIVMNAKNGNKLNKTELVVSSGYSVVSAKSSAHQIMEEKGVKEELENLGFDVESAKRVAKNILKNGKEENKVKIIQEIFKVSGEYAPEKQVVLTKKIISADD